MQSDKPTVKNPTNSICCAFRDEDMAAKAKSALAEILDDPEFLVLHGKSEADKIDGSSKWFADTHLDLQKLQRRLRRGMHVLCVSIEAADRDRVSQLLKDHDAEHITHFGKWTTEVMK